jgi:hypothetical protein
MALLKKCILCGKAHQVRFCKLPGAKKFRKLTRAASNKVFKVQCLNKPKRYASTRSKGAYRKKAQLAYSGAAAAKLSKQKDRLRQNPTPERRQTLADSSHMGALNMLAIKEMDNAGYVNLPKRCPACRGGKLKLRTTSSGQATKVSMQCDEWDCKASFSPLSFSTILPPIVGKGLTPAKVHDAIKAYTSCGLSKRASPECVAKQISCGKRPLTRLYSALTEKEAELGEKLNASTRLKVNVEVDGHRLRTGRLGHRLAVKLYPGLVDAWKKKNKNKQCPKYWLLPVIVLGAWQRGSDKGLLCPGRLKLSAPSSKPGTEGVEEVRAASFFSKVTRNSVIFPDGAVAWNTVAQDSDRGLKVAAVVHANSEFVRRDSRAKSRGASRWRGTQTLDRRWNGLNDWVGKKISTLIKGEVNPKLWTRVRSYQWRCRQKDVYTQLGAACKKC